jgi:predicted MPP superfamily phosphohydrolase
MLIIAVICIERKGDKLYLAGDTSRGVGTSRIKMRYFCPPEITIITLRNGRR